MPRGPLRELFEVRHGDAAFRDLSASEALLKVRELTAQGLDPFLFDNYGDPMGLIELEEMVGPRAWDDNPFPLSNEDAAKLMELAKRQRR